MIHNSTFILFLWMDSILEVIQLPVSCAVWHCCLCIMAVMMNVPVRNPTNVLLLLIIVSLTPSHVPSQRVKSFVECLSSSRAQHQQWVIPPPTCFSSPPPLFSLLFFDLLKPHFFYFFATTLPPTHLAGTGSVFMCVFVVWCISAVTEPI